MSKKDGVKILNGDVVNNIIDAAKGLVAKHTLELVKDFVYLESSVNSPDLTYAKGIVRNKRSQESVFVFGKGSVGIDTSWSVCEPFFVKPMRANHLTPGSLSSLNKPLAKEIDHAILFLPEFSKANSDLISQVKSMLEENLLVVYRSYSKGMFTEQTKVPCAPSIFIGTNHIPKEFDNPFMSRFDSFYRIFWDYGMWKEISDIQVETIGKYDEILKSIGKRAKSDLSEFKHGFQYLKDLHDFKVRLKRQPKYNKIIVLFDDVREKFQSEKDKILERCCKEKLDTLFPRDTEIGLRRINSSAWLNILKRQCFVKNKILFIKANDEDLKEGIESLEKSVKNKSSFFKWREKKEYEKKGGKFEAKEFYEEHYDEVKDLPYRGQSDWMEKNGHKVSYGTLKRWSNEISQ
jgi:hypothetical protein